MKRKIIISVLVVLAVAVFGILISFLCFPIPQQALVISESYKESGNILKETPPEKEAAQVTLQFFGDIMLDRDVVKVMGKDDLDYIFAKNNSSSSVFVDADLTMANLEGPFASERVNTSKTIAFRFDPKYAAQLKSYGFDAFNLANNHSYDMRSKNVAFTRETLAQNGLAYFGDEYHQGKEYTYIAGEDGKLPFNIAFIGLNTTEGAIDMAKVKEAIDDAKGKAKFIIVNIHWGQEYHRLSNQQQQDLAHQLIDWGVDAIIGHHPHVAEEIEVYKGHYIFYSLGNFIFDQYFSKDTQEGMSVGLIISDDGSITPQIIPFFSKKSQVQVMAGTQKDEFIGWLKSNSRMESSSFEF
jgi:poly-gamma-glutamate synthesis protein (capsule biosynthesis protein)